MKKQSIQKQLRSSSRLRVTNKCLLTILNLMSSVTTYVTISAGISVSVLIILRLINKRRRLTGRPDVQLHVPILFMVTSSILVCGLVAFFSRSTVLEAATEPAASMAEPISTPSIPFDEPIFYDMAQMMHHIDRGEPPF